MITMLTVQSRMARVVLGWGCESLATAAEVSPDTIARLERGETLYPRTLAPSPPSAPPSRPPVSSSSRRTAGVLAFGCGSLGIGSPAPTPFPALSGSEFGLTLAMDSVTSHVPASHERWRGQYSIRRTHGLQSR
jgi:hypothetical protein